MSEQDRDQLLALLLIVLSILILVGSFKLLSEGVLGESPGLLPGMAGTGLLLTSVLLFLRSWKNGGRVRLAKIAGMFQKMYTDPDNKKILLAIIFVGLYIFVGVRYIGFYLSSGIFMVVMFLKYVKRFKRWISFLLASGLAVLLYLTFNKLFMLSIK